MSKIRKLYKKTDKYLTEDKIRDSARIILGFDEIEDGIRQGTGQITTFNQLGFTGSKRKPDGWYLPNNITIAAIILEKKAEDKSLYADTVKEELFLNCNVIKRKYRKVIGILYNGKDIRVFVNGMEIITDSCLHHKSYYLELIKGYAIH